MKKQILITLAFLSWALSASAQFMNAPKSSVSVSSDGYTSIWVGYSPTTMKTPDGHDPDVSFNMDFNTYYLGGLHAFGFNTLPLLVETGAVLEWMHTKDSDKGEDYSWSSSLDFVGIKVPLNVLYTTQLSNISLSPYVGINAKCYVLAKVKNEGWEEHYNGERENYSETTDVLNGDDSAMNRFTLGYQFGIRAQYSRFLASIGYSADITEIADENRINKMITLGVGYAF